MTSLQQKYIIPFLLVLSGLATIYIFFILNQHTNLLKYELKRKGIAVLENFTAASEVDILLQDEDRLSALIEEVTQKDDDVDAAGVYINDNQELLSSDSTFQFPTLSLSKFAEYDLSNSFLFVQPIEDQPGNIIGIVGISVSKSRINTILYNTGLRLILIGIFSFSLVGYFVNFLTRRLKTLADSAIEEAKQIEEAYVELQNLQGELEATNVYLEERVKVRTEELNDANTEFQTANGELKEFAYIVSHDLKAPLRAIDSLTEWIVEDYEESLDEEGKSLIKTLKERVTTMNRLIDGVLQYSRISRTQVNPEKVDLNEVVEYVWALLKPSEHYKLIIKKELPTIHINYDKIQDVFLKIMENAIRFNDKSECYVSIDWGESQDFLNIMINDNGIGIPEKQQQEIFKIFRTLDKKTFPNQIGLGLTLAKRVIEFYGGDIIVESTPEIGTTFTFSIPKQDL